MEVAQENHVRPRMDERTMKRKFAVWSDTLLEESIGQQMSKMASLSTKLADTDDEATRTIRVANRDTESYEYTVDRTAEPIRCELPARRNRKRNKRRKAASLPIGKDVALQIKEELGKPSGENEEKPPNFDVKKRLGPLVDFDEQKTRSHILVNEFDSDEMVVREIAKHLNEPKVELIERCVKVLGKKKTLEFLYATEDIEVKGGMMTSEGHRFRTPGGVFIQLVRKDDTVLNCQRKQIFIEDAERKKRQKAFKRQRQPKKPRANKPESKTGAEVIAESNGSTKADADHDISVKIEEEDLDNIEESQMIYFEE